MPLYSTHQRWLAPSQSISERTNPLLLRMFRDLTTSSGQLLDFLRADSISLALILAPRLSRRMTRSRLSVSALNGKNNEKWI